MNQIDSKYNSLEALKSFNSTIVTCRLYPPEAPQVSAAVDRGYKLLKEYLRREESLVFALINDTPYLSGQMLSRDVVDSFANLVIYRQLRHLGRLRLVIGPEMDRFAFGQLLSVFNTAVDKIKRQGGGAEFITSLGLMDYFPDSDEEGSVDSTFTPQESQPSRSRIKVRPALLACLLGSDKRPALVADLKQKMTQRDEAIAIILGGIAQILQELQEKKIVGESRQFSVMLKNAEKIIPANLHRTVCEGVSTTSVETLKNSALCVVLCQNYPTGIGTLIYEGQVNLLSQDRLGSLFVILREQLARVKRKNGTNSPQVQFLGNGIFKLMNCEKGKAFLSGERAKKIIHEGERTRKKNRLKVGVKELLGGISRPLDREEFVGQLPGVVWQMAKNGEDNHLTLLLKNFIGFSRENDGFARNEFLMNALITIGESLVRLELWNYVDLLHDELLHIVNKAEQVDKSIERILELLQNMMQKRWQCGDNNKADGILKFFHLIRSGQLEKGREFQALVGKIQDRGIIRADMPGLLAKCLASPKDEILSHRLIYQGPVVVRYLIESLIQNENSQERLKIIDLLTYSPSYLTSAVLERLPEHMPWYGKRNLIKLLGETGTEADAELVMSYLNYHDVRVQREAFLCIYKIGGKSRKKLLLNALDESSEFIKIDIITALRFFCDDEVSQKLTLLLNDREQFSDKYKNTLVEQILVTLGRCSNVPALKGVQKFLSLKGQRAGKKIPDSIWKAGEKARKFLEQDLKEVRKQHVQANQLRKNALKQVAKTTKTNAASRVITGSLQESSIRSLLSRGEKEIAQRQLLGLIERVAGAGNFVQTEKLREWLVEIDETALSVIVEAAEIIDREKADSIETAHLEIWNGLYEVLSSEEFTELFHSLQHRHYANGEFVVHQGATQPTLFFINSGKVKLFFQAEEDEVVVKTLSAGEIFGSGAFFDASVWTLSVSCLGAADISFLGVEKLKTWNEGFPGIKGKLRDFCKQFESIEAYIAKNERDRRVDKRTNVSGRIRTTLLDAGDRSAGVSPMVELCDISKSGVAYLMRISTKENLRQLLGRKVRIELPCGDMVGDTTTVVGEILALKQTFAVENDYSVHVKFDSILSEDLLAKVIAGASRGV